MQRRCAVKPVARKRAEGRLDRTLSRCVIWIQGRPSPWAQPLHPLSPQDIAQNHRCLPPPPTSVLLNYRDQVSRRYRGQEHRSSPNRYTWCRVEEQRRVSRDIQHSSRRRKIVSLSGFEVHGGKCTELWTFPTRAMMNEVVFASDRRTSFPSPIRTDRCRRVGCSGRSGMRSGD